MATKVESQDLFTRLKAYLDNNTNEEYNMDINDQYTILYEFLHKEIQRKSGQLMASTRCTAINFDENLTELDTAEMKVAAELEKYLQRESKNTKPSVRLFVVENVCIEILLLLGEELKVDPLFWAAYLENYPWYRISHIQGQSPFLPSFQAQRKFLKCQAIVPVELPDTIKMNNISSETWTTPTNDDDDRASFIQTTDNGTRIKRKAGILYPRARLQDAPYNAVAFVRESIVIWADKHEQTCNCNAPYP